MLLYLIMLRLEAALRLERAERQAPPPAPYAGICELGRVCGRARVALTNGGIHTTGCILASLCCGIIVLPIESSARRGYSCASAFNTLSSRRRTSPYKSCSRMCTIYSVRCAHLQSAAPGVVDGGARGSLHPSRLEDVRCLGRPFQCDFGAITQSNRSELANHARAEELLQLVGRQQRRAQCAPKRPTSTSEHSPTQYDAQSRLARARDAARARTAW